MQYMVVALDGKDEKAMERRMASREAHLKRAGKFMNDGTIVIGGALMDGDGRMIGSGLVVEAESKEALDAWLAEDPYVTGGVWKDITIYPIGYPSTSGVLEKPCPAFPAGKLAKVSFVNLLNLPH